MNLWGKLLEQFGLRSPPTPSLVAYRESDSSRAAVVFLHGFGGDTAGTWGKFPQILLEERDLKRWDVFALGYPSSLRIDVAGLWEADPDLSLMALSFRTALNVVPLKRYKNVAIIAHSMGGLIAQRAIVDADACQVGQLVLFGCPSAGLAKALIGARLKRQARDMGMGSTFIRSLREDWQKRFGNGLPFALRAVAGEKDEFVPPSSSLLPFPDSTRRAVPGNHLEIVKPTARNDRSVQVVIDALSGSGVQRSVIDSALVAVELREFSNAVDVLLPRADEIDDPSLVQLALALESLNRGNEALQLLEKQCERRGSPSTDALGVLAGRFKRRWLTERIYSDWERARSLYVEALRQSDPSFDTRDASQTVDQRRSLSAREKTDPEQAMYHAINVAFLDLMITPQASAVPETVASMAARALEYASAARNDHWRSATQGDALLMLGQLSAACIEYGVAVQRTKSPREIDSMYSQAIRLSERIFGEAGIRTVETAFGASAESAPGGSHVGSEEIT